HRLNLDDAVVDLRHLLGEQLRQELGARAREEDLRSPGLLTHLRDVGAHPLVAAEVLARQNLVAPQDRLGAAEVDDDVAELLPLDETVHDLADAADIFVVLALPLRVAHPLHDDLLRGLRGDAAEVDRRQRVDDEVADLGIRLDPARRLERKLRHLVLDLVHDLPIAGELDVAGAAIDLRADIVLEPVLGATGLLDRLLHRLENFVGLYALLAGNVVRYLQKLGPKNLQHLRL